MSSEPQETRVDFYVKFILVEKNGKKEVNEEVLRETLQALLEFLDYKDIMIDERDNVIKDLNERLQVDEDPS